MFDLHIAATTLLTSLLIYTTVAAIVYKVVDKMYYGLAETMFDYSLPLPNKRAICLGIHEAEKYTQLPYIHIYHTPALVVIFLGFILNVHRPNVIDVEYILINVSVATIAATVLLTPFASTYKFILLAKGGKDFVIYYNGELVERIDFGSDKSGAFGYNFKEGKAKVVGKLNPFTLNGDYVHCLYKNHRIFVKGA